MNAAIDIAPDRYAALPPPSRHRFSPTLVPRAPQQRGRGELVHAHDGRGVFLRAIDPADVAAMQRCFRRLSPEDVRRRFLHSMSELPEPMARRLCTIDPEREAAFVLMDEDAEPAEMRGVGRIYVDESANSAEFSVLVEPTWARVGLGALLMNRLVDECRRRALDEVWGYVLLENRPMLQLCKELGFTRRLSPDDPGIAQIALLL